ncbi:hypothetical protein CC2G_005245 [Coprinopsis cinerea AmutBmut pab1-1]|nr:hypothetical protein CC2G_005245 [Coprinopsis cinerea AmutBmut pab1-1]
MPLPPLEAQWPSFTTTLTSIDAKLRGIFIELPNPPPRKRLLLPSIEDDPGHLGFGEHEQGMECPECVKNYLKGRLKALPKEALKAVIRFFRFSPMKKSDA